MRLTLKTGQGIQITGPTKLRLIEGRLSLLGTAMLPTHEILIQSGKHLPFEAELDSQIELTGESPQYCISETSIIPLDRKKLVQKIELFPSPVKIMVIGQVDTGKTTLICYLANYFFTQGKKVAVIDLDTGQQDIGPPTTINMGILNKPIFKLGDVPVTRMYFIGRTSPKGRMLQIIIGARDLVDHALKMADIILIDTTGWVFGGAARAFKDAKIRALEPDFLVALQNQSELAHILKPFEFSNIQIESLSIYSQIQNRDHSTRRFLRESAFNKYFDNAKSRVFNLDQLRIENSFFKSGQILSEAEYEFVEKTLNCNFIYMEQAADILFLVKEPTSFYDKRQLQLLQDHFGIQEIYIVNKAEENGLLVGLLDKDLTTLGIGLIEQILYKENKIRILTPVTQDIFILQFGFLRITKTGQEISELNNFF